MSESMRGWRVVGLFVIALAAATAAFAQEPPTQTPTASAKQGGAGEALPQSDVDVSRIDQILRGEEKVFEGEKFTYDPANRRDPFVSLAEGVPEEAKGPEERPEGLAGMTIGEIRLEGIVKTSSGIIAMVQGRDKLSYILRPGTKLYDGEVKEIFPDRVVFKQQVNDPKATKPFREVVREVAGK
jgi:Tfp pilus assembly protein PilP